MQTDIAIRAGRVVCSTSGIDAPGVVFVSGNRIQRVGLSDLTDPGARKVFDFPDGVLLPGLIDLHAHPANCGSVFGVAPDEHMLRRGVTTVISQGDAGADNIDNYVSSTIAASGTRVRLAINLSRIGESTHAGCFEDLTDADVDACVAAIDRHRHLIPFIAVNVSHNACGSTDPREVLRRGLEAADQSGLPLLFGMRRPEDWPLQEQLELLRPGDIVTYCFRREPHCIVENDQVLPCVREARQRGVLFDVGHGTASFCFDVAEVAIGDGFYPDSISTDLQSRHLKVNPIEHDLPLVMSKLSAAGMPDDAIFAAVSSQPAACIQANTDIGSLAEGVIADLVVLESAGIKKLVDAHGREKPGKRWSAVFVMSNGEPIPARSASE